MAARDRFGGLSQPAGTPLQRYIMNACDPQNFEPNLAVNLEITDLINQKKGNAPREAAVTIVQFVNHRNSNVALLALNLLDICVKNCGYPFHLQISTKEFLNEFVRRFPERPPMQASRVQTRILELIEEWRSTICQTSRYKEDLGYIRDMHRLLSYKGYTFPRVRQEDAAVLNPSDNLRSADEMEEEERAAQSAKLQELIRRGTPQDLQEANRMMKIMAGYDTRNKTNYRAKAAEEVSRVQQKARLLEEMLQGYKPGDEVKEGDVYAELANALQSAHPKIQKMCEEESDDHEAVAKLLEINDSIHRTIERYKLIKKGDVEGASKIPKGTLGTSGAGVSKGADNELSLIDLGGPDDDALMGGEQGSQSTQPSGPQQTAQSRGNALEDDLLGLSLGEAPISLGPTNGFNVGASQAAPLQNLDQQPPQQPPAPPPPQQQPSAPKPNYDPFGMGISSPPPTQQAFTPKSTQPPRPQQQAQQLSPASSDPFASLSTTPRTASPFQFQQSLKSASPAPPVSSSGGANLLGLSSSPAPPQQQQPPPAQAQAQAQPAATDDEWTFSSALPDQPHDLTVLNSSVNVVFNVSRQSDDIVLIKSRVSNNTFQPVSELTFQLAVTKGYSLKLEPQSGRSLAPKQQSGITQTVRLHGVERGKGGSVKMRWKASYVLGGERKDEQGEIASLEVS